jgi:VWFA-related protein
VDERPWLGNVADPSFISKRKNEAPMRQRLIGTLLLGVSLNCGGKNGLAQTPEPTPALPARPEANLPAQPPAQATPSPGQTAPGPAAQPVKNPDGTYTIRSNARLVVLDMVVTDKKGNLVTDLTKDEFHVTEAGDPETILNFETAGAHTVDPTMTIDSTADLDRLAPRAPVNIILLDEFNTRFEDMAFARYSLEKWLKKQPDKLDTPTMLLSVSLEKFEVLRDYTQNKQAILDALNHHFVAFPWQAHNYSWVSERYSLAFLTLQRVAEATIGHVGHKNMIWIGRGFPAINFADFPVDTEGRINSVVQVTVNRLRDARVTLYTIDPAGIQVYNTYGSAAEFNDPFGGNYQFAKLATATGGSALYGRNDVDAEIGTTIRDGSSFYTLTYRPTNDSRDPAKFRKIVVTVDRPGLTVTTRQGYFLARGPGRVDPMNPSRRLVNDLVSAESSTMVYDGLPMTVSPLPEVDNYLIHIDAKGVGWYYATDTAPRHAEVILLVTQFDKKGKELKRDGKSIKLTPPGAVAPTGHIDVPLNFPYKLERVPKAVRARIVVRMATSGRIGTADLDLTGPPAAAATPPGNATP